MFYTYLRRVNCKLVFDEISSNEFMKVQTGNIAVAEAVMMAGGDEQKLRFRKSNAR